jgi:hypothetical protein
MRQLRRRAAKHNRVKTSASVWFVLASAALIFGYWQIVLPIASLAGHEVVTITPVQKTDTAASGPVCLERWRGVCVNSREIPGDSCLITIEPNEVLLADRAACMELRVGNASRVRITGVRLPLLTRKLSLIEPGA